MKVDWMMRIKNISVQEQICPKVGASIHGVHTVPSGGIAPSSCIESYQSAASHNFLEFKLSRNIV
jgi:hypothetical protein